jgi:hypothetical protein
VLTVGLDRLRIPRSLSSVPGPESATGCLIQGSEPASVSCTALTPDLDGRCGFASPGHRKVQRLVVKSDGARRVTIVRQCARALDRLQKVGECCRVRSSASSVAADGGSERANPVLAKVSGGEAAAVAERRCSELALKPASFTRCRGSGSGTSEVSRAKVRIGRKRRHRPGSSFTEVSRAS